MGFENANPDNVKVDIMTPEDAKLPQQVEIDLMTPDKMAAKSDVTPEKKAVSPSDDDGSKLTSMEPGVVSDTLPQKPEQKEGPPETKAGAADAQAFDAEMTTVKTGIDQVRALLNDVKNGTMTDDRAVVDAFKTANAVNESAKQLVAKADTPEKKIAAGTLLEEAAKVVVEFQENVKDIEKKKQAEDERKAAEAIEEGPAGDAGAAGSTAPEGPAEPKKTGMERVAEGFGKAIEKIIEFLGKISEAVSKALDKAGVNKKNMLKLFGNVPIIGDILRSKVQVDDIHAQIEKTFGQGKLLKTDKDSEASSDLRKAFDNETKPAGSTENFEQFVQKRIDAVKAAGKTEQITIEDLVNIKPIETKPADAKPDEDKKEEPAKNEKLEKQIQAVKDLGGVEKGDGTWEIPMEADGTLKTVQIKQNPDGTWEWANAGRKPFGRFTPDAAGLAPEFKSNQQKLNGLADTLGIPKTAPAPEQYAGTPDQKAKLKELISQDPNVNQNVHMLALAKALRAMGISAISDTDVLQKNILNEKTVNAALKTSLKNFFQYHATKDAGSAQEALGIYWNGDVLKEGYIDNDELDNDIVRGVNLENDPIGFIQALATFEIADGNESATTGYDLNDRAFSKIKTLKEKLTASLAEFTS